MPVAVFYTRADCPLCEEAWEALATQGLQQGLQRKDISADPVLIQKYGWRIPVVAMGDDREFDIALDEHLQQCLEALSSVAGADPI